MTCDLYYSVSPGPLSILASLLMGHPGKMKSTLPYLTKAETRTRKPGHVTGHVENSGER